MFEDEVRPPIQIQLPFTLENGMTIRVNFRCEEKIQRDFQVKLKDKDSENVVLFVRYKTGAKRWVFNAKENGRWHTEESLILHTSSNVRLLPEQNYSFTIRVLEDVFAIGCARFDPEKQTEEAWQYSWKHEPVRDNHINNFRLRQGIELAEYLAIKGHVVITKVMVQTSTETVTVLPREPNPETSRRTEYEESRQRYPPISSRGIVIYDPEDEKYDPAVVLREKNKKWNENMDVKPKKTAVIRDKWVQPNRPRPKGPNYNLVRIGDKWVPETEKMKYKKAIKSKLTSDAAAIIAKTDAAEVSAITPVIGDETIRRSVQQVRPLVPSDITDYVALPNAQAFSVTDEQDDGKDVENPVRAGSAKPKESSFQKIIHKLQKEFSGTSFGTLFDSSLFDVTIQESNQKLKKRVKPKESSFQKLKSEMKDEFTAGEESIYSDTLKRKKSSLSLSSHDYRRERNKSSFGLIENEKEERSGRLKEKRKGRSSLVREPSTQFNFDFADKSTPSQIKLKRKQKEREEVYKYYNQPKCWCNIL